MMILSTRIQKISPNIHILMPFSKIFNFIVKLTLNSKSSEFFISILNFNINLYILDKNSKLADNKKISRIQIEMNFFTNADYDPFFCLVAWMKKMWNWNVFVSQLFYKCFQFTIQSGSFHLFSHKFFPFYNFWYFFTNKNFTSQNMKQPTTTMIFLCYFFMFP